MIPIANTLSIAVLALTPVESVQPGVTGQAKKMGGFAETLAMAQKTSSTQQSIESSTHGVTSGNPGDIETTNPALPPPVSSPSKKLLNIVPVATNNLVVNSLVASKLAPMATPVMQDLIPAAISSAFAGYASAAAPVPVSIESVANQSLPSRSVVPWTNVSSTNVPTTSIPTTSVQPPETVVSAAPIMVPGSSTTSRHNTASTNAVVNNAAFSDLLKANTVPIASNPSVKGSDNQDTSSQNVAPALQPATALQKGQQLAVETRNDVQTVTSEKAAASIEILPSGQLQPETQSVAAGQNEASAIAVPDIQTATPEGMTSSVTLNSATSAPVLLASANLGNKPISSEQAVGASANSHSDATDEILDAAAPANVQAPTGTMNPPTILPAAQATPAVVPSMPVQSVSGVLISRVVTSKTTTTTKNTSSGNRSTGVATTSAVVSAAESETENQNETPYSIFFAGPGPGSESAVSILPRMILPAATTAISASAIKNAHAGMASGQSSTAVASGEQNGTAPVPPSQNVNDTPARSGNGSLPIEQTPSRDAAIAAVAPSSSIPVITQAAAVATPATASTSPLPQPTPIADPPTKSSGPPPSTQSASASALVPGGESLPAAAPPGPVQMAQMVNRAEQSEMRIGMSTSAFGSVEVRTVIHANDVALVVGSEKGDLRTLLGNDLPAITNTLQQQSLRLNSVNFMQGFAFSNDSHGDGGGSQQRSFVPTRAPTNSGLLERPVEETVESLPSVFAGVSGSLSILA